MPNFFTDNPDILFHLEHLDLARVIEIKEDGYAEHANCPYAPVDLEDALDSYRRVLEIVGAIAGDVIEPRAEGVDREGATWDDGVVTYARGTREALDALGKAGLMGFTLPRAHGGLNMAKTTYSMAIEMVSRADAALMNIFGLMDIAETICNFGSEEQQRRYLPRFADGSATGAMDLTEPDAGSDLQAVRLRAWEDEHGNWFLRGVKRFITNGCGDIHLVLARSEEGTTDGRGLSLFIYDAASGSRRVRRIEDKLGIHGSPTCELQFNDAPCELLGRRRAGLIRYTMSLMNGARLAIAAQSLGIAEAAMREAVAYASERTQFKQAIDRFAPVREMLDDMRVGVCGGRSLLYETARVVDLKEALEHQSERYPERKKDLAGDVKRYSRLAGLLTPLVKAYNTEMCNKVAYDAIQIHGGVGFTREFRVERHYRDARITNIYEGTTQLQVVAAIGGVTGGVLSDWLAELVENHGIAAFGPVGQRALELQNQLEAAIGFLKGRDDYKAGIDYHGRRLVDMAADTAIAMLLCRDARVDEARLADADYFTAKALARAKGSVAYIHAVPIQGRPGPDRS